jgi:hypothetical protein
MPLHTLTLSDPVKDDVVLDHVAPTKAVINVDAGPRARVEHGRAQRHVACEGDEERRRLLAQDADTFEDTVGDCNSFGHACGGSRAIHPRHSARKQRREFEFYSCLRATLR